MAVDDKNLAGGPKARDTYQAEIDLVSNPASVRQASTFIENHADEAGVASHIRDSAVILTSEVVTKAFLHSRSGARFTVTLTPRRLQVQVEDDNSRLPRVIEQRADATNGRGLLIPARPVTHRVGRIRDGPRQVRLVRACVRTARMV